MYVYVHEPKKMAINKTTFYSVIYVLQTLRTISNLSKGCALPSFPIVFIATPIPAQFTTTVNPPMFSLANSTALLTWPSSVT